MLVDTFQLARFGIIYTGCTKPLGTPKISNMYICFNNNKLSGLPGLVGNIFSNKQSVKY